MGVPISPGETMPYHAAFYMLGLRIRRESAPMTTEVAPTTLLEQVETSRSVCEWLRVNTQCLSFKTTKRSKMACASHGLALEHHEGLVELVAMGKVGAGLALSRSVLDSYALGLWMSKIATPEQLDAFIEDRLSVNLKNILPKLRGETVFGSAVSGELDRLIDEMNGFTHGNVVQLRWRYSKHDIQPRYPEVLQIAMLRTASIFAFLAAYEFQTLAGHIDLRDQMFLEANTRLGFVFADVSAG